jgi:LacI family transcriptional regulator
VGPEDSAGARLAVEHLLSLGHSRVAYVRTPLVEQSGDRARYAGYRTAMRQAGLATTAALAWTPGSDTVVVGRRRVGLRDALGDGNQRPTALFVSNDIGAISMIEACEQIGLAVPADLSVVGFDDIAIAALHRISLTTVAQPLDFQAERAVSLLLERIDKPRLPPRHVSAPVELRVRGSTAAPAA